MLYKRLNNLFEINLRSKKWLLRCSYNHHKENIASHLNSISAVLDKLCTDYENIILLDDNVEVKDKYIIAHITLVKTKNMF